mgnify:FL=1
MIKQPSKISFIVITAAYVTLPITLNVLVSAKLPQDLNPIGYAFAFLPVLSFPVMLAFRTRIKRQPGAPSPAALIGFAVAEFGVLLSIFVGSSRSGGLMSTAVAIPMIILIAVYTLNNWPSE